VIKDNKSPPEHGYHRVWRKQEFLFPLIGLVEESQALGSSGQSNGRYNFGGVLGDSQHTTIKQAICARFSTKF